MDLIVEKKMEEIDDLHERINKMFNNGLYSDVLFVVNDKHFYASSHLVAATSTPLASLVKSKKSKKIIMRDIEYEDSFQVIVKYIYGVEIKLHEMKTVILCEVLTLSEHYELKSLFNGIKFHLSKMEDFQIETTVVLLNIAHIFKIKELYDKLKTFVFQNVDRFLRHESFKNLHHIVLADLLSSKWFFAYEINILKALLQWHRGTYVDKIDGLAGLLLSDLENNLLLIIEDQTNESDDEKVVISKILQDSVRASSNGENDGGKDKTNINYEKEMEIENDENEKESKDENGDIKGDEDRGGKGEDEGGVDEDEGGVDEDEGGVDEDEGGVDEDEGGVDDEEIKDETTKHKSTKITQYKYGIKKRDSDSEKKFSENILKALLSHIRAVRISLLDYTNAFKTILFKEYKKILGGTKYFSQSYEDRIKYLGLFDTTKTFTVDNRAQKWHAIIESDQEYVIGNWKWKLSFSEHYDYERKYVCTVSIKGFPSGFGELNCKTKCQVRLISHDPEHKDMILPENEQSKPMTFKYLEGYKEFGVFIWDYKLGSNYFKPYKKDNVVTFEVQFFSTL